VGREKEREESRLNGGKRLRKQWGLGRGLSWNLFYIFKQEGGTAKSSTLDDCAVCVAHATLSTVAYQFYREDWEKKSFFGEIISPF
jgi:hypothetical protein